MCRRRPASWPSPATAFSGGWRRPPRPRTARAGWPRRLPSSASSARSAPPDPEPQPGPVAVRQERPDHQAPGAPVAAVAPELERRPAIDHVALAETEAHTGQVGRLGREPGPERAAPAPDRPRGRHLGTGGDAADLRAVVHATAAVDAAHLAAALEAAGQHVVDGLRRQLSCACREGRVEALATRVELARGARERGEG